MSTLPSRKEVEFQFEVWRRQHGLEFASAEEQIQRLDVFEANNRMILEHNANTEHSWIMNHNQFSHLTPDEFKAQYLSANLTERPLLGEELPWGTDIDLSAELAASVDWTTKGAVTAIKNQGNCGSCWSFSTTGSIEGAYFLSTGKLVSMSEQQLVDCDYSNSGCNGGWMTSAMSYVRSHGIATETGYPYRGYQGVCTAGSHPMAIGALTVKGSVNVLPMESALASAVNSRPVSVAVDASSFQFYAGGVLSGACGTQLNHAVLAVGYTDTYWKVKNSWGLGWGEMGYVRMQRGTNKCGIANGASYPVV